MMAWMRADEMAGSREASSGDGDCGVQGLLGGAGAGKVERVQMGWGEGKGRGGEGREALGWCARVRERVDERSRSGSDGTWDEENIVKHGGGNCVVTDVDILHSRE